MDTKTVIMILVCVLIAIIVILVLIGLAFQAGYKKDGKKDDVEYLWHDRKRNKLGLPWSFVKYLLSEDRFFRQTGFFKTNYDEVRLYRILDVKMSQTLLQKMTNLGTITVHSSDKSLGCFEIANVKNPKTIKELLSEQVEIQRDRHRVYSRESMNDIDDGHDDGDIDVPDFV